MNRLCDNCGKRFDPENDPQMIQRIAADAIDKNSHIYVKNDKHRLENAGKLEVLTEVLKEIKKIINTNQKAQFIIMDGDLYSSEIIDLIQKKIKECK